MIEKVISGKTILLNTVTNTTWVANDGDEMYTGKHESHSHIEWAGELSIPVKNYRTLFKELYEEIKHGDENHQKWLKEKIDMFILKKCL